MSSWDIQASIEKQRKFQVDHLIKESMIEKIVEF